MHQVRSGAVRLAVSTRGEASGPTVVAVHGFPDTQAMWGPVADRLVDGGLRVVTYDVRGAGASTAPSTRDDYRADRLVDDLVAVLDDVQPDGSPVHLLGHDWGSVQTWESVLRTGTDERLRGRIASFTSISGPPLFHYSRHLTGAWRRRDWRTFVDQARRSWYVAAFQLPVVPELVFRRLGGRLQRTLTGSQRLGDDAHWASTFGEDGAHGVNLYRANARGTGSPRHTDVPVQLLVPLRDTFISPDVYDGLEKVVPDLLRVDLDAGHWVTRTHPDVVAGHVRSFVAAHTV
ncbi:alpha/beta fold hydrolase [Solicola sp. PLA-1-18]|uniref:alpha/beta fold hydrolase n=1 Tax=Solicola sp. PLA-1-18 TaxID=3380532 RepID=UPI003B7FB5C5